MLIKLYKQINHEHLCNLFTKKEGFLNEFCYERVDDYGYRSIGPRVS